MIEAMYDCPEGFIDDKERAEYYSWHALVQIYVKR